MTNNDFTVGMHACFDLPFEYCYSNDSTIFEAAPEGE